MEDMTEEQKLKITVYKDAKRISKEAGKSIGMEVDKPALELIGELTWKKIKHIAEDLELFAKHAKRTTINADDVKLLVRRNPDLQAAITKLAAEESAAAVKDGKKKREVDAEETEVQELASEGNSKQDDEDDIITL